MREILFRGYNIETKTWYMGMLGKFDGKYFIDDGIAVKTYVDEKSIGQYTGYKDKNDKKIFEGDVICWGVENYGYIEYFESGFRIVPEALDLTDYQLKDISKICEVVNNRFEDERHAKDENLCNTCKNGCKVIDMIVDACSSYIKEL